MSFYQWIPKILVNEGRYLAKGRTNFDCNVRDLSCFHAKKSLKRQRTFIQLTNTIHSGYLQNMIFLLSRERLLLFLCVSREIDPILCEKCVEVPSYSKLTVQCCHAG